MKVPQMIGYVRKFKGNTTSFKINGSKLLIKYNQTLKKLKKLLKINFNSEPIYGDNNKHIQAKIKIYGGNMNTNFQGKKNTIRKSTMRVFINNTDRFCCQSKKKVLSWNTFERMQIWTKKDKMENLIDDDLEQSLSDESDNEANSDSNDETKSDDDNNESNE